jgi:hypothetical protein
VVIFVIHRNAVKDLPATAIWLDSIEVGSLLARLRQLVLIQSIAFPGDAPPACHAFSQTSA